MLSSASLGLPQFVSLLDQFHIAFAFTLIGILATLSVCVSFFFRTLAEGVSSFYEFRTRCGEARERFRRAFKEGANSRSASASGRCGPSPGCLESGDSAE
jgi:hypothetical protein